MHELASDITGYYLTGENGARSLSKPHVQVIDKNHLLLHLTGDGTYQTKVYIYCIELA